MDNREHYHAPVRAARICPGREDQGWQGCLPECGQVGETEARRTKSAPGADYHTMTPEAQRVAIAESCGWKIGPPLTNPEGTVINWHYSEAWRLPDYLNDLNAMHEAEKSLTPEQRSDYHSLLLSSGYMAAIDATAAQRAEAFLRALGQWQTNT